MNAGQRMARISVGAAVENIVRTAALNGWRADVAVDDSGASATVTVVGENFSDPKFDPIIEQRATNRKPYDGRPLPNETLTALRAATPERDAIRTYWITSRDEIARVAAIVPRSDALMFGNATMRTAFFKNVRFDAPPDALVDQGMSLASMEAGRGDRVAMRIVRNLPAWFLQAVNIGRTFASKSQRLVESASGLCLVVAPDDRPATDLSVGRAIERAWLAATEAGCAAQPMMSLAVLEGALRFGSPDLFSRPDLKRVQTVLSELRAAQPVLGTGRLGFLLRFGYAPPPSGRCGRLLVQFPLR
jgi:hypothetical protein